MNCEYLYFNGQPYCRYWLDKRHWRPCCDVAAADEHLEHWRLSTMEKDILAETDPRIRKPRYDFRLAHRIYGRMPGVATRWLGIRQEHKL